MGAGVHRSSDKGATWTAVNTGLTATFVTSLAVSSGGMFAATNSGIFRTTDGGAHWTPAYTDVSDAAFHTVAAAGQRLLAGTTNGSLFMSTNNGDSWEVVSWSLGFTPVHALVISGRDMFAGTSSTGAFRVSNAAASWLPFNAGLTNTNISVLTPMGTGLFAGTAGGGVFHLTENGVRWTEANNGLTRKHISAMVVSGAALFAGTDSGVFISTDSGSTWNESDAGLSAAGGIPGVTAFITAGEELFAGTTAGLFHSSDNGAHWTLSAQTFSPSSVSALGAAGQYLFAAVSDYRTYTSRVYRSADNGATWTETGAGLPRDPVMAFAVHGGTLFAGTLNGIYLSADTGAHWESVSSGLGSRKIFCFAENSTHLMAGTEWGVWIRNFNDLGIPEPPQLLSPADSAADLPITSVKLSWKDAAFEWMYRIQVSTDSTFATVKWDMNVFNAGSQYVSGLTKNTTYYWRVNATNDAGTSAWSKRFSFSTIGYGTTVVKLVYPPNGHFTGRDTVNFKWRRCTAPVQFYEVLMSTDGYSTGATTSDTSCTLSIPSRLAGTTYSWKVRARTDTGYGSYSDAWTFTKLPPNISDSGSAVNGITLVSPLNGSRVGGRDSCFRDAPGRNLSAHVERVGTAERHLLLSDAGGDVSEN